MRLAVNICLWAIAIASWIMFMISESTEAAHGWLVIAIGTLLATLIWGYSVRNGRILSRIEQAANLVRLEDGQSQIEQEFVIEECKARKFMRWIFVFFGYVAFMAGMAVWARWRHASDKVVYCIDMSALVWLLMMTIAYSHITLRLRLISLYRRLLQAAPGSTDSSTDQ